MADELARQNPATWSGRTAALQTLMRQIAAERGEVIEACKLKLARNLEIAGGGASKQPDQDTGEM